MKLPKHITLSNFVAVAVKIVYKWYVYIFFALITLNLHPLFMRQISLGNA